MMPGLKTGDWRLTTRADGYTFIELLVVSTMLLVLASAILPLTKVTMQRMREAELRRDLREMRTAIDKFKEAADLGNIAPTDLDRKSTRLNSSHLVISYAVFCLKKKI